MLMSHLPGTIEYWASSSLYQIKIRRVFLLVIFVWKRKMSSSSFMKTRDSNVVSWHVTHHIHQHSTELRVEPAVCLAHIEEIPKGKSLNNL
ncbi:uncharacterized protein LOC143231826 isoform X4 [Tachypleus tridentatus]|uniref:uncharacterized protein LOC143231826 isoform X4 n=1 Tax=Tachypleus tridentatus TaxID=6853 RepID=UPI003FD17BA5